LKAKNLQILKDNGLNVPKFMIVNHESDLTPAITFLFDDNKKYAVRSSFSLEDGTHSSFAGQFTTLLNVDKKDLKAAVRDVKDSLYKENVQEYCLTNNINIQTQNNRVIIQEMVAADYSGVIFTANPHGCLNEIVIVVGSGLGNNVVEDKADVTSYFYNQDDKNCRIIAANNSPTLSLKVVHNLIKHANKIKELFNQDMDIEFAIKDEVVYILQARPITTIKGNNLIILDNSNIVESYPGVSLPLTQDFVKKIYADIFTKLCFRLTENSLLIDNMRPYLDNMIEIANWRIYYNISNWYVVLKLLPFSKKIIPMWQKMMGVTNQCYMSPDVNVSFSTKMTVFKNFCKYLKNTPKEMNNLCDKFLNNLPN
jgi:pyruvate,water dikinase